MKEYEIQKCPRNKGLQGFVRVGNITEKAPDNEVIGQVKTA